MSRIIAREPFLRHMPEVHNHLNRQANCRNHIPVNIINDERGIEIKMAIPGLKKSEIDVYVKDDVLFAEAKVPDQKNEKTQQYKLRQFDFSNFNKRFQLPETIDKDKMDATYKEGILSIKLARKAEGEIASMKKIKIV